MIHDKQKKNVNSFSCCFSCWQSCAFGVDFDSFWVLVFPSHPPERHSSSHSFSFRPLSFLLPFSRLLPNEQLFRSVYQRSLFPKRKKKKKMRTMKGGGC